MVGRRSSVPRSRPSTSGAPTAPSANDARVTVPKLNADPIWSLRPWPVILHLVGEDYDIPALPAADWLAYLMQPEPDFDGILEDYVPDIEDLLVDGDVGLDEAYEVLLDLVGLVSSRPWWVALRLVKVAMQSWDVLGPDLIKRGVDADRHSLAAWLDVLLVSALNNMEPKDTTMFLLKLEADPRKATSDPMDDMEMDRSAFLAMGMN